MQEGRGTTLKPGLVGQQVGIWRLRRVKTRMAQKVLEKLSEKYISRERSIYID
jgi:hypothetical protein